MLSIVGCSSAPLPGDFRGTPFTDERQAEDFQLTDQFGNLVSLRDDYTGRVVVLTFLYTNCPDVCPIVANHLRDVAGLLEQDSFDTDIVVVSVDPEGDTVDAALAYSERWKMTDRWSFLTGDESTLKGVWGAYYIDPYLHGPGRSDSNAKAKPTNDKSSGGVGALARESGLIIHSAPIYIIDANGAMRSAFTLPLEPQDVVHDIRLVGD